MKKISFLFARNNYVHLLCTILVFILAIFFAVGKDAQQLNRRGDAAIFEQIIESINSGKGAVSNVFANTQNYIERGYFSRPIDALAAMKLELPTERERNMLNFHAYYIMFALAPLVNFIGSSLILSLVQSLCFFGLLVAAWAFVYGQTRNIVGSTIFGLLLAFSPNWIGGIQGQFYPDRIFVLAGFLLCGLAYQTSSLWRLIIVAIIVGLINERAALIGGLVLVAMPLYSRSNGYRRKLGWYGVGTGLFLLAYAYIQKNYILTNMYYGGYLPHSLDELLLRLHMDGFVQNIGLLFLGNILLVCLSLAAPRLAVLSLIVMLPNIVGNVGGAEKTNWFTHYHSYYFPVLAFSAAVGFSNIYRVLLGKFSSFSMSYKYLIIISVGTSILAAHYYLVNNKTGTLLLEPIRSTANSFSARLSGSTTGYTLRQSVSKLFKPGSLVATDELGMAILHDRVMVGFFPVGLEISDYIYLPSQTVSEILGKVDKSVLPANWLSAKGFNTHSVMDADLIGYCTLSKSVGSNY